jgi:hypothetical protein
MPASAIVRVGASASDVADEVRKATDVEDMDAVFRDHLESKDVPKYIAKSWWIPVTIEGGGHTLEILAAPDYGAVGTNGDPFRIGKESQFFAQEYVDAFDAIMPSQRLLKAIEAAADPKLEFIPVSIPGGGANATPEGVVIANDRANAAMDKAGVSPTDGKILIGYRKAYVVRPGLNGDYIAIYGGRASWAPKGVQPPSGHAHTTGQIKGTTNYSDYSHGIVLVSRKAKLDGVAVDLRDDVFNNDDDAIVALVSDEGRFDPVFPNAGEGSLAKFSVGGGGSEVRPGGPPAPKASPFAGGGGGMSTGVLAALGVLLAAVAYAAWKMTA